jgi:hypothetical protein
MRRAVRGLAPTRSTSTPPSPAYLWQWPPGRCSPLHLLCADLLGLEALQRCTTRGTTLRFNKASTTANESAARPGCGVGRSEDMERLRAAQAKMEKVVAEKPQGEGTSSPHSGGDLSYCDSSRSSMSLQRGTRCGRTRSPPGRPRSLLRRWYATAYR